MRESSLYEERQPFLRTTKNTTKKTPEVTVERGHSIRSDPIYFYKRQ